MNNEITMRQKNEIEHTKKTFSMPSPQEMDQLINFCKVMSQSPFYQKIGPGGVMAIYLTAKELNLPFMCCLNGGLHTFDGKVTMSAQLINMMIVNAGHRADVIELSETHCKMLFIRSDRKKGEGDIFSYEYTIKQAEKAGYLKKTNWQTSPKDMLYSRCLTGGGRKFMPDVFMNVLVHGELVNDDQDSKQEPILPQEVSQKIIQEKEIERTRPLLDLVPNEGFPEFVLKHDLFEKKGYPISRKLEFIRKSCEKSGMVDVKVINFAMQHEEDFERKFRKWELENYPEHIIQEIESDNEE